MLSSSCPVLIKNNECSSSASHLSNNHKDPRKVALFWAVTPVLLAGTDKGAQRTPLMYVNPSHPIPIPLPNASSHYGRPHARLSISLEDCGRRSTVTAVVVLLREILGGASSYQGPPNRMSTELRRQQNLWDFRPSALVTFTVHTHTNY